jgi:hypothetical protein
MKEEKQYWTMKELLSITETVQEAEIEYGEKSLKIQWCELTESEEPKMVLPSEDMPEEEKTELYVRMASDRVTQMMTKADDKNPKGTVVSIEHWNRLPTNLRYSIQNKILGSGTSFQDG